MAPTLVHLPPAGSRRVRVVRALRAGLLAGVLATLGGCALLLPTPPPE